MFSGILTLSVNMLLICGKTTDSELQSSSLTTNGCVLPSHPDNGYWKILNGEGETGDIVPSNSILIFHCVEGYMLSQKPYVFCIDNWSELEMPYCEKLCPPIYPSSTTILSCTDKLGQIISCSQATDGSTLTYECSPFYEVPIGHRRTIFCLDGIWTYSKPECHPVCGKKIEIKPLVYGGRIHSNLEYPWIVAIYMKEDNRYMNICGGTIINTKIVVTAAHCVTNDYADPHSPDDFIVAAAKLYNKFKDSRDKDAQYIEVSRIIVHSQYKGDSRRFLGDIALIVTKYQFKLGPLVQPICINDLSNVHLYAGLIGEIAGWGATENGLPADRVRSVQIPYKTDTVCSNELPPEWAEKYYVLDKMCVGSPQTNISVCEGDSGNGLVFKNVHDGRYYLHGLVSIAPSAGGSSCNIASSALFTKVAFYYNFIDAETSKINRCRLPPFPKNGKWVLEGDRSKVSGNIVARHEMLTFVCDPGYELTTSSSIFDCESLSSNMPSCQATFVANTRPVGAFTIFSPRASTFLSTSASAENKSMNTPTPFSSAAETSSTTSVTSALEVNKLLETFDCGKKNNEKHTTMANMSRSEYPWVVAIYKRKMMIAVGSLISKRIIVTTARALVVNIHGTTLIDVQLVRIGLGKYYIYYGDTRDTDAQYLEASKILTADGFDGIYGNIALVVLKKPIEFNQWIQPACIKDVNKIELHTGDVGVIYGWSDKIRTMTENLVPLSHTYKSPAVCLKESPILFQTFAEDFVCGSAPDRTAYNGDLGSGWVFKNLQNDRYYLHAVCLTAYVNYTLGENNLYVSLKQHYNFIMINVKKYG